MHEHGVDDVRQHREAARDGLLARVAARDDVEGGGCRFRDGLEARAGLVDAVARHDDHEVRRLAHAEHGIHGDPEDGVAAERDERLRLGVPEPGAAARGDDDDGDR